MIVLNICRHFLAIAVIVSTVLSSQQLHKDIEGVPDVENVLWVDPGDVASLDFEFGVGGPERQPQPPFTFVSEDMSGTNAKVNVTDGLGTNWNVKFGKEAHSSVFCSRLLWACGYYAQTEYFIAD